MSWSKERLENFRKLTCGKKNSNWKGGRIKHNAGYIYVMNKEHPDCNQHGYVFEHRVIMERVIGRRLRDDEVVHHINGVKDDNRVENLIVMRKSQHKALHQARRNKERASNSPCLEPGCHRRSSARGYCKLHYERYRRSGMWDEIGQGHRDSGHGRRCSVRGCSGKHEARGYCNKHYLRYRCNKFRSI